MITKQELLQQYKLLNISRQNLLSEDGEVSSEVFDQYVSIMERMQVIVDHVLDLEEQEKNNES